MSMIDTNTLNQSQSNEKNNSRIVVMCIAMVLGMGGLAYASVPLYQLFCQVTGYGGTTQQVDAQAADGVSIIDRDINIRFDAKKGICCFIDYDQAIENGDELPLDMVYVSGMHLVNRIGYLITKEPIAEDFEVTLD